jgi:hypothetical protein
MARSCQRELTKTVTDRNHPVAQLPHGRRQRSKKGEEGNLMGQFGILPGHDPYWHEPCNRGDRAVESHRTQTHHPNPGVILCVKASPSSN